MLRSQLRLLFTAFTFLTRVPVWRWSDPSPEALGRSVVYFPVVGWAIGALAAGAALSTRLCLPPLTSAFAAIGVSAILTGCFHEDAFADVCDAFGGGSPERRLEIMHDSRVGSFGTVGTVVMIGMKASLIAALPSPWLFWAVVAAHTLGRWSSVFLLWLAPYVPSSSSLAKPLAAQATIGRLAVATVLAALPVLLLGRPGLLAVAVGILLALATTRFARTWVGGLTGDILGAANQLTELLVLAFCVALPLRA